MLLEYGDAADSSDIFRIGGLGFLEILHCEGEWESAAQESSGDASFTMVSDVRSTIIA